MDIKENEFVPRVTQLDAAELDNEVIQVMKSQVVTASKYLKIGILGRWEPEIDAMLRILIWKFSVNSFYGTFGQQLLNVKYKGQYNKDKAFMLALMTIGSKYVKERSQEISELIGNNNLSYTIKRKLDLAETTVQIASFINLLVFLREGKYPTLPDRLLGMRPISIASPGQNRNIGYSFMLRELLWHGFIELIVFTIPLINYHYIRRKIINMFSWQKSTIVPNQNVPFSTTTKCTVCKETPILPYLMGCGHIFCFYCIHANHLADPKYECHICGYSNEDPTSIIPLQIVIAQQ